MATWQGKVLGRTLSSPRAHPCKDFAASFSRNKRYMIRDQTYFFMEFLSSSSGKEEEYQPRDLLSCVRTQKVYRQDGRHQSCYSGDSNKGSFGKSLQNEKKADIQNNKILDRITVALQKSLSFIKLLSLLRLIQD